MVATAFVVVFAYANIRTLSPTEKLKQIHLASFKLKGEMSSAEVADLEKKVSNMSGVTACSINRGGTIASVTFHPDVVSEETLSATLSNNNQLGITKKEFATSGGCPVHQVSASVNHFLTILDLRN